ncbi:MAG: imidazole glycerol phosphate synthase subunit HisF [Burkholderiaceae bacterium]
MISHRTIGNRVRPVLVTTRGFGHMVEVGDPVSQARIYEAQMADELVVLNIDSTPIGQDVAMLDLIEHLASETFMPLAVGGGVQTVDDFARLLERGADKVVVNTAALESPELIRKAASRFGAQCVVVSVDFRLQADGTHQVMRVRASQPTGIGVLDWAKRAVALGAGELILTDADRDGSGDGLNIAVGRAVAEAVPVPVVLSGGCGRSEHFASGFLEGLAEGVAAGTFFSLRDQNPMQTRAHIRNAGVAIRVET